MKRVLIFILALAVKSASAQDTVGTVTVIKDPRIDVLGKKMADYYDDLSTKTRTGKGYRLMLLSTSDREQAMKLRADLYRLFPDQKQYMSYQLPNIKIKFGNFTEKDDAEKMRKQIMTMKLVTNNIYILPETIEIKPEKKDASGGTGDR